MDLQKSFFHFYLALQHIFFSQWLVWPDIIVDHWLSFCFSDHGEPSPIKSYQSKMISLVIIICWLTYLVQISTLYHVWILKNGVSQGVDPLPHLPKFVEVKRCSINWMIDVTHNWSKYLISVLIIYYFHFENQQSLYSTIQILYP